MKTSSRLVFPLLIAGIVTASLAAAQSSAEPKITLDAAGARALAVSNLPVDEGCFPAESTGRITKRHLDKGKLAGVTVREAKFGEGYVNVPQAYEFKVPGQYDRVSRALDDILVAGRDVKIKSVGCGAAGRMVHLEAVSVIGRSAPSNVADRGPPATSARTSTGDAAAVVVAPAPRPTKWVVAPSNRYQLHIEIKSIDRAFSWSISCSRNTSGVVQIGNWFQAPPNWSADWQKPRIAIDDATMRWEIDGADEGIVLSDSTQDNTATLSVQARSWLAAGERLTVAGKTDRGRARNAVFDISGGRAAFDDFDARCLKLPAR